MNQRGEEQLKGKTGVEERRSKCMPQYVFRPPVRSSDQLPRPRVNNRLSDTWDTGHFGPETLRTQDWSLSRRFGPRSEVSQDTSDVP